MSAHIKSAVLDVGDYLWSACKTAGQAAADTTQWVGGALSGEFNTKASFGQIVFDAGLSMFPLVGEATAARDATAIALRMTESEQEKENIWNWISFVLCLLPILPIVGGPLKGVGRLVVQAAKDSARAQEIGRAILGLLRKLGYGDPYRWLMAVKFSEYSATMVQIAEGFLGRIAQGIVFGLEKMQSFMPQKMVQNLSALPLKISALKAMAVRKIPQALKELDAQLNKVRQQLVEGSYIPVRVGAQREVRVMTQEARVVQRSTIQVASKGYISATPAHYRHKEGWPHLMSYVENVEVNGKKIQNYPNLESFTSKTPIEPVLLRAGESPQLVRVLDKGDKGTRRAGGFWTETLPPDGKTWRLDCAVKTGWSHNGEYIILDRLPTSKELKPWAQKLEAEWAEKMKVDKDFKKPKGWVDVTDDWEWDGVRAWYGQIAEQTDRHKLSDGTSVGTGILLPGGNMQLYIDFYHPHHLALKKWLEHTIFTKDTKWKDKTIPQEVTDQAEFLKDWERAIKTRYDGGVRSFV